MNQFDYHPLVTVLGIPLLLALFVVLVVLAGRALERIYTERRTAAKFAAGALADPHGDYSIFSRPNDSEARLQVVHRDMPDTPVGTVHSTPSGFLAQYGEEAAELHPTADQATHAVAARHEELQPIREVEERAAQANAAELAQFKKSPRG